MFFRVKLIVTEIFDAAVFGEFVIPTLVDAHKNLLATNNEGVIIPMGVTLYIAAVESQYIRYKSSVSFEKNENLRFLNFENVVILIDEDYYDTEKLENVNVNYITEPTPILQVNFNDLKELENFNEDRVKETISTSCQTNGSLDALVISFKLHLDEEIELDSSNEKSCWQLAIFPLLPQAVTQNDRLTLTAEFLNKRLKCSWQSNNRIKQEKLVYKLPRDIIMFLNDKDYIECLIKAAISKKNECIRSVYDTSPFPFYGLTVLKENLHCEALYCQTDNLALKNFIEHIIKTNSIDKKVYFVSDSSEITSTLDNIFVHNFDPKGELLDLGQQTYREKYRWELIVFFFFLQINCMVQGRSISNLFFIISCLLSSTGTLLPERIFLMGQIVYSKQLINMVSVKDWNVQGLTSDIGYDSDVSR